MRSVATTLLSDRSFFIEFHGYLSNHAKHAIIALEKLNASEARVQEYWDEYTAVTPYNLNLKPATPWKDIVVPPAHQANKQEWFTSLRGKKQQWQEMCIYLEQELYDTQKFNGNTNLLVKEYAPNLVGGIAGALTHGIIHLGWALDADMNDWMTIEGLAYLNFCYLGIDETKLIVNAIEEENESAKNKSSNNNNVMMPMKSMERVAKEFHTQNLGETWISKTKKAYDKDFHPELVVAGFQWELSKILDSPHDVATQLPTWLNTLPEPELFQQLYQTVTWIYLATRNNDTGDGNFLVLHLITSLWGLEHVCSIVNDPEVTRKALQQYYSTMICLLAASSGGFPTPETLQQIQTEFPLSSNDDATAYDWKPVVARGIEETEEHNIKLVYAMKELWNRYNHWKGFSEAANSFTTTPNIGPATTSFKA